MLALYLKGQNIYTFPRFGEFKNAEFTNILDFSPDNTRFITATNDNTVQIWFTPKGVYQRVSQVYYLKPYTDEEVLQLFRNNY